jgi:hypothetical protein
MDVRPTGNQQKSGGVGLRGSYDYGVLVRKTPSQKLRPALPLFAPFRALP